MNSAIADLLDRAARAGVAVEVHGGKVRLRATTKPPDDLVAAIRDRKAEILETLGPPLRDNGRVLTREPWERREPPPPWQWVVGEDGFPKRLSDCRAKWGRPRTTETTRSPAGDRPTEPGVEVPNPGGVDSDVLAREVAEERRFEAEGKALDSLKAKDDWPNEGASR
jgi:hypothetical protein